MYASHRLEEMDYCTAGVRIFIKYTSKYLVYIVVDVLTKYKSN